ncbi:hypothetical protein JOL79_16755 [Microbispora sp. RL4-1S]|uniref:Pyruvate carboxyltransferase domain-containing protein n=1 Tax=Microbispora oryzae TaxID=2806554 RepID=A0A941AKN8_9ACTN|nr:hypothetical protein [Microbispora oryzae]MBP2705463.1 hypothetical protein [Microbispora oryzae]
MSAYPPASRENLIGFPANGPLILDVTLRDGGYVNKHSWTLAEAVSIVRAVDAARVPYVEVGYLGAANGGRLAPSSRCEPDYLGALRAEVAHTRLAVMVRPPQVSPERIVDLREHGVEMLRIVVPGGDVTGVRHYFEAAREAGLAVVANLTHISRVRPEELAERARLCAEAGAELVYLADSNGSLYPSDVKERVEKTAAGCPVPLGFHPHNNLGLAFINSCVAVDAGVSAVDASIGGIGKGGGNLPLELVVGHYVRQAGADYRVEPLLQERSTYSARLRMLSDGTSHSLVAGLLDVSLDQAGALEEQAALNGYDAVLRSGI